MLQVSVDASYNTAQSGYLPFIALFRQRKIIVIANE